MDLHVDILLKILRDFLPLKDKLHALFEMKEFLQLVTYRGAYLSIFLVPIPSRFLRGIRARWYVARDDWVHRFFLGIDERTLHVSLRHYVLEGFEIRGPPDSRRCKFFARRRWNICAPT